MNIRCCIATAVLFGLAQGADASETTTYEYDALGRLVAVETDGGVNDGMDIGTEYDDAGNRSSHMVTGVTASNGGNAPLIVAVPLGGIRILILGN